MWRSQRVREAEIQRSRGVHLHSPLRGSSCRQPVPALGERRAPVPILCVEQAGGRGLVWWNFREAETPADLQEPDQVLDAAHG